MKVYLLALAASLLISRLEATDRFFRDLEVSSPNGRFRVEAKSPDNVDGPWSKPFQSDFLYRLLEEGKDVEVWSRPQPLAPDGRHSLEGPPVAIHVSNDSWVVVRTANTFFVVVDPSGQDRLRVEILGSLLPDPLQRLRYQRFSTAGTQWGAAYCHAYFVALGGKTHFCLTTWWGDRLLIDLPAGCVVPVSPEFETVLNAAEKSFLMSTLQATSLWRYDLNRRVNPGLTKDSPGPAASEVIAAMFMSARLKTSDAVPFLRQLESSPVVLTTTGGSSPYQTPPGGVKPTSYQNLTLRQTAQLCLRRLGLQPGSYQSTRLYRNKGYWYPEDPLPFKRAERVEGLQAGMKPEEVMALVGAPDFIKRTGWEYDLDGEHPATLVLRWGEDGLETTEKHVPPKWQGGVERDCEIVF